MNCVKCSDLNVVRRSAKLTSAWKDACYDLLVDAMRLNLSSRTLSRESWNVIASVYYLEIVNFVDDYKSLLKKMITSIVSVTALPPKLVTQIVRDRAPGIVSARKSESEIEGSILDLRYSIVRDAFDLDFSLLPQNVPLVNSLGTKGQFSLFESDKDDGCLGIVNEKRLNKGSIYTGIIPPSSKYANWLLGVLKKSQFVLITTLPESDVNEIIDSSLKVEKFYSISIISTLDINTEPFVSTLTTRIPTFPFRSNYMPPFSDMFDRLINNNLVTNAPIEWSAVNGDFNLGIVQKHYPSDYELTSSLADHFAEPARIKCKEGPYKIREKVIVPLSPYEAWVTLMLSPRRQSILSIEDKYQQREEVWKISKGCRLFNASLATYIYSRFCPKGGKVLDMSSGWGDRLIGAYAAGVSEYVHYDPNPELEEVYKMQHKACKAASGRDMKREYNRMPFEDDWRQYEPKGRYHEHFNIAFTSPPFYDKEIYTGVETSTARYKDYNEWLNEFFRPLVVNAWKSLLPGGWLALYLPHSDLVYNVNRMHEMADKIVKERLFVVNKKYSFKLGYVQLENGKGAGRTTFMWRRI